jgi:hypothetical protein
METTNLAALPKSAALAARLSSALRAGWKTALPCVAALLVVASSSRAQDNRQEDIEVSQLHISDFPKDPAHLLANPQTVAAPMDIPLAKGRTSTVFQGRENESQFNLHSYIAWHGGLFIAAWSSSKIHEEDPDQHILFATSKDGHTWSAPRILARDPDGPQGPKRWITRGLFADRGKLYALGALVSSADYGKRGKDVVWKDLALMRYQWSGKEWEPLGPYAENCMNNFPPERLGARLFMACRDRHMDLFTATADPSDPTQWTYTRMTMPPPFDHLDEPSWFESPDHVAHMIIRDNLRSHKLIHSYSRDAGQTWSLPVHTNYPDATSKNFTGRTSTGWFYLINNPNAERRDPLAISFSRDGWTFDHPVAVRKGAPQPRFGRKPAAGSLQYPHAMEHNGSLWVIYSTNKEDIQITEIRLADLDLR